MSCQVLPTSEQWQFMRLGHLAPHALHQRLQQELNECNSAASPSAPLTQPSDPAVTSSVPPSTMRTQHRHHLTNRVELADWLTELLTGSTPPLDAEQQGTAIDPVTPPA
jgi:hypothetical protein